MNSLTKRCVTVKQTKSRKLSASQIIEMCLPEQGAIKVQQDQPHKEHRWHYHDTHETIVILKGQLLFFWEGGKRVCGPGDVIDLPQGLYHGSRALEAGAKYVIAFRQVEI